MPSENMWASFFNVDLISSELQIGSDIMDLVGIGWGYGKITIPSAKWIKGSLCAFDIEDEMTDIVKQ